MVTLTAKVPARLWNHSGSPEPFMWNIYFKNKFKIFYWPFQGGTSFVDLLWVFLSCICYAFVCVCQDTNDKLTVRYHKREPRGQPFPSRWPQGTNKQTHTKAKQTQDRKNINDPQKKYRLGTVSKNILLEGFANLALNSDLVLDTFKKVTKHNKHGSQEVSPFPQGYMEQTRQHNTYQPTAPRERSTEY